VKKPSYVLDSFAVLAYFQAESGGPIVKDLLKQAAADDALAFLSLINLGEIVYNVERKMGDATAANVLSDISQLPIRLADVTLERVLAAARVKAHYAISYADAFAIALAQELDATLVTGDPEFKQVESLIRVLWL
jgi:predicted nucleic acid-binding protein